MCRWLCLRESLTPTSEVPVVPSVTVAWIWSFKKVCAAASSWAPGWGEDGEGPEQAENMYLSELGLHAWCKASPATEPTQLTSLTLGASLQGQSWAAFTAPPCALRQRTHTAGT